MAQAESNSTSTSAGSPPPTRTSPTPSNDASQQPVPPPAQGQGQGQARTPPPEGAPPTQDQSSQPTGGADQGQSSAVPAASGDQPSPAAREDSNQPPAVAASGGGRGGDNAGAESPPAGSPPTPPPQVVVPSKSALASPDRQRNTSKHIGFNEHVTLATLIFHEAPLEESNETVAERLYHQGLVALQERQKVFEERKNQPNAGELEGATFKPAISKAAQNLPSHKTFEEFYAAQEERVKYKLKMWEKKKQKHLTDAMEDVTFRPEIGKKTKVLIDRMKTEKRYKDPLRGWRTRFEAFVMKEATAAATAEANAAAAATSPRAGAQRGARATTPNSFSRTPSRSAAEREQIFDRLYVDAHMRAAAQQIVAQAQVEESNMLFRTDRDHENFFYDNAPHRSPDEVVAELLERGEKAKQKIEQKRRQQEEEALAGAFTPKTNKLSQSLVQRWSAEGYESPHSRKWRATATVNTAAAAAATSGNSNLSQQRARSPNVGSTSATAAGRGATGTQQQQAMTGIQIKPAAKFDVDLFYSKIQQKAMEREAKVQAMREQKEREAVAGCTFRPATCDVLAATGSFSVPASAMGTPRSFSSNRASGRLGGASDGVPASSLHREKSPSSSVHTPRTSRAVPGRQGLASSSTAGTRGGGPVVELLAVPPAATQDELSSHKYQSHQPRSTAAQHSLGTAPPTSRTLLDDDGDTDLATLEAEYRNVIAEWSRIDM